MVTEKKTKNSVKAASFNPGTSEGIGYHILTSDLPLNRTEIPSFWWRYFSDRNPEKDFTNPD
jgi:hypothetical protein